MLAACEKQGRNALTVNYDARNPFQIDARNLQPIYRGSPTKRCPYCSAVYAPEAAVRVIGACAVRRARATRGNADQPPPLRVIVCVQGSLCDVCQLSEIGVETLGLVAFAKPASAQRPSRH